MEQFQSRMTRARAFELAIRGVALWAFCGLVLLSFRLATVTYPDDRVAFTFDSDGPRELAKLIVSFETGTPYPSESFFYGNATNFFSFLVLWPFWMLNGGIDYTTLALGMVGVQLLAVLLLFFSTKSVADRFVGVELSLLTALSVCATPIVLFWAVRIHPDVLQLALIFASIALFLRGDNAGLLSAAAVLGLATGTKFLAGSYLIFFVLAIALTTRGSKRDSRPGVLVGAGAIFCAAFASTNFSLLTSLPRFLDQTLYHFRMVGTDSQANSRLVGLVEWPSIIGEQLFPFLSLIVLIVFFAFANGPLRIWKSFGADDRVMLISAAVFSLINLLVLTGFFTYRPSRYMMHLIPAVVLIFLILQKAMRRALRRASLQLQSGIVFFVLLGTSIFNATAFFNETAFQTRSQISDERLAVGQTLAAVCDQEAAVLSPMYSYAPAEFSNLIGARAYTLSRSDIDAADLLLLNSSVPGRFYWPEANTQRLESVDEAQWHLFAEVFTSPDFRELYRSSEYIVLERLGTNPCDNAAWQ